MSQLVWMVGVGVVAVWGVSTLVVLLIGVAAHRRDPRVVMDDPWEAWEQPGWERLRDAVIEAYHVDEGQRDLSRWEQELASWRNRDVRFPQQRAA